LVYDVQPDTPADDAGLRAGDIIVQVGQNQVQGLEDLQNTLAHHQDGKRVMFFVWRYYFPQGWRKGTLTVTLGD
jgi:serine protease Do